MRRRRSVQEYIDDSEVKPVVDKIVQDRRFETLVHEAAFSCAVYPRKGFLPGLAFFKWMASVDLPLQLPPTLLTDTDGTSIVYLWFDSNTVSIFRSAQHFQRKVKMILHRLSTRNSTCDPIAVVKSAESDVHVLPSLEDVSKAIDAMIQNPQPLQMIQKYVKAKGSSAWIARTVYKRRAVSMAWIITTKQSKTVMLSSPKETSIVASTTRNSWIEPKEQIKLLAVALETHHEMKFDQLVGDFLQDADGHWWLLQIKTFKVQRYPKRQQNPLQQRPNGAVVLPSISQLRKKSVGKEIVACPGRYCDLELDEELFREQDQTFMSYKDLLQAHFTADYLEQSHIALSCDSYATGLRDYFNNQPRKERNRYYNRISVCPNCSKEYKRLRKEAELIKKPVVEEPCVQEQEEPPLVKEEETPVKEETPEVVVPIVVKSPVPVSIDSHLDELEALLGENGLETSSEEESDHEEATTTTDHSFPELPPVEEQELSSLESPFADLSVKSESPSFSDLSFPELSPVKPDEMEPSSPMTDLSFPQLSPVKWEPRNCVQEIWERNVPKNQTIKEEPPVVVKSSVATHLPVHSITIEHCQSIFFDETYKESLLSQAREAFKVANRVRFFIPQTAQALVDYSSQQMVLRTLHMELRDECVQSNASILPSIERDEQGNTVMILVPSL